MVFFAFFFLFRISFESIPCIMCCISQSTMRDTRVETRGSSRNEATRNRFLLQREVFRCKSFRFKNKDFFIKRLSLGFEQASKKLSTLAIIIYEVFVERGFLKALKTQFLMFQIQNLLSSSFVRLLTLSFLSVYNEAFQAF